jgi:hypothetical protein
VALVDASDAFHPESAAQAGVDLKRLLWVRCSNRAIGPSGDRAIEKPNSSGDWWVVSGEKKLPTRKERLKPVEQALKATDLLLQSDGFGLIVVDLGDVRPEDARRVPLTTWFRFRRAIENTPTTLVIIEQEPYAKTCASLVMELKAIRREFSVVSHQSSDETLSAIGYRLSAEQIAELPKSENLSPQRAQRSAKGNRGFLDSAVRAPLGMTNQSSAISYQSSVNDLRSCASVAVPTHSHLLHGLRIQVEISRGQLIGKTPVQSVPAFESRTELAIC